MKKRRYSFAATISLTASQQGATGNIIVPSGFQFELEYIQVSHSEDDANDPRPNNCSVKFAVNSDAWSNEAIQQVNMLGPTFAKFDTVLEPQTTVEITVNNLVAAVATVQVVFHGYKLN